MSSFLPDMMPKKDNETTQEYIDRLYEFYELELKGADFSFQSRFVYHKTEPSVLEKDGGFWHIITKEYYENKEKNKIAKLPCKDDNGFMVCTHLCKTYQEFDPYRIETIRDRAGKIVDPRFICLNRAERITWIKALIKEAEKNPEIFKIWEKKKDGSPNQINTHIWYEEEAYLIVLGRWKNEEKYNMITSFVVNYKFKRQQLEKDYQRYLQNGKNPV